MLKFAVDKAEMRFGAEFFWMRTDNFFLRVLLTSARQNIL